MSLNPYFRQIFRAKRASFQELRGRKAESEAEKTERTGLPEFVVYFLKAFSPISLFPCCCRTDQKLLGRAEAQLPCYQDGNERTNGGRAREHEHDDNLVPDGQGGVGSA